MAIAPQTLEASFKDEIEKLEGIIDINLIDATITKGQSISMYKPIGMSELHFQSIKRLYLSVGWSSVEITSDQREGTMITFRY